MLGFGYTSFRSPRGWRGWTIRRMALMSSFYFLTSNNHKSPLTCKDEWGYYYSVICVLEGSCNSNVHCRKAETSNA